MPKMRLGTRGSRLAMAQANRLRDQLSRQNIDVEIVPIRTSGDQGNRERLGAFVHEIQIALLENRIDLALHCLKDLPTTPVPGLVLTAHLEREDPCDTLITRGPDLASLPLGAMVGTGSIRRTSQLAAVRPDLRFRPLVGNIDTRIRKLQSGEYDAIVLAQAGLQRLGIVRRLTPADQSVAAYALATEAHDSTVTSPLGASHSRACAVADPLPSLVVHPLSFNQVLPAPGQGVLVIETRAEDAPIFAPLNHPDTERAATAERAFLRAWGSGCSQPIAALATVDASQLELQGLVATADGQTIWQDTRSGSDPELLGQTLADILRTRGAELPH